MPIEPLDLDGFIQFLKDKQGEQTDRQFAQSIGITPQYLCDVYKNRRVPGDSILRGLTENLNIEAQRCTVFYVNTSTSEKEKE